MEGITCGGGEFIRDMFNAVTAIVGGGPFLSAVKLAFTLGLLFAIFHTAFSMNLMTTIRWFVTSLVIYLVMIVPKVDVQGLLGLTRLCRAEPSRMCPSVSRSSPASPPRSATSSPK